MYLIINYLSCYFPYYLLIRILYLLSDFIFINM